MMDRREFLTIMGAASAAGLTPAFATAGSKDDIYSAPPFGNARLLHFTDCHAQLEPVYFREPNVNIGIGAASGRPPHLVGAHLLDYAGINAGTTKAHAFTYLDFAKAAETYGKVGGFAHLTKAALSQSKHESTVSVPKLPMVILYFSMVEIPGRARQPPYGHAARTWWKPVIAWVWIS